MRVENVENSTQARRKAAIYIRMSTDNQKYSPENQRAAMQVYADRHLIDIVKEYTDGGRSGLNFSGRKDLQAMISDVEAGTQEFSVILVLDVTRWGRYQDVDESAYYEFICRRAGYDVQYIAEQFTNDGSLQSTLMKNIKRSMAGEYSRELSVKVFAGQCRLIEKGYRQGGTAGYGLRRQMIDEHGNPKGILGRREYKSLQSDRVILIPGPDEEIENVRWIYRAFVDEGKQEGVIAAELNNRGILTDLERPWTRGTVHQVLTNEKYIGHNVFNRTSFKLKMRHMINPPDMWIRRDGAFEGIVEPRYFYEAQGIIRERSRKFTDEEMLDRLKNLHEKTGWLSGLVIDEADDMPSSSAYAHRFGSLVRAYHLVGYTPDRDYRYLEINRQLRAMHPEIVEDTIRRIKELGGDVWREVDSDFLFVNGEIKVSIVICRCVKTTTGRNRWKIRIDTGLLPDITIAIRMDEDNKSPLDYYILPALDIEDPQIRLADSNGIALDSYRFDDMEDFFSLTRRAKIPEAA